MNAPYAHQAAVVVGRWQIAHLGHLSLFEAALGLAPRVLIVVGSSFRAREPRNPFTWQERVAQISAMLTPEQLARVEFVPIRDYYDHDRWNRAVRDAIAQKLDSPKGVVIVGHKKDSSTYYLDHFREWTLHQVESYNGLNASDLRNVFFGTPDTAAAISVLQPYLHGRVAAWLAAWAQLPYMGARRKEHAAVKAYREKYTADAYVTADGLLRVGDYVLLVRRGKAFGHGLWAVPGGFVNPGERTQAASLRELYEETSLGLLEQTLRFALKDREVFEDPARSPRGRLISHAYYYRLGDMPLPEVKGRDDAMEARWVHINDLLAMEELFFEDHFLILDRFLTLLPRDSAGH